MRERGHPVFAAAWDRMSPSLERRLLGQRRPGLLADLAGEVLELGAGTGTSLPLYRAAERVVVAEPDPAMRGRLEGKLAGASVPVELSDAAAEALPFPDASFDAVVAALVLCTVADLNAALAESRRVLRAGGWLVVLEHVRGRERLAVWQDRLAPVWTRLAAGCHPNRETRAAIERAGFALARGGVLAGAAVGAHQSDARGRGGAVTPKAPARPAHQPRRASRWSRTRADRLLHHPL